MPRKTTDTLLPAADLRALMGRTGLMQSDVAWMVGVGTRQARAWCLGEYAVPQYAAVILLAFEGGLITPQWLDERLNPPTPGR